MSRDANFVEANNITINERDAAIKVDANKAESDNKDHNKRRFNVDAAYADAAYTIRRAAGLRKLADEEGQKNRAESKSPSLPPVDRTVPRQTEAQNKKTDMSVDSSTLFYEANDEHDLISGLNHIFADNAAARHLWVGAFTNLGGQGYVRQAVAETLDIVNAQAQAQEQAAANGDAPAATNPEATMPPELNPELIAEPAQQTESKAHQVQRELEADISSILRQQAKGLGIDGPFGNEFLKKIIPKLTRELVLVASLFNPEVARDIVLRTGSQVLDDLFFKHVLNEVKKQVQTMVVKNYHKHPNCYFNELNNAKNKAAQKQAPTPKFGRRRKEDEDLELKSYQPA